jgi:hypothetical protein
MPRGMGCAHRSTRDRVERTIVVIREHLGDGGALLYRYRDDDGLPGQEGFFTPCSFWLAGALAYCGRLDEAAAVLEQLIPLANDVGLYSEELASDRAFLGSLPQALTHASLISAATAIVDGEGGRSSGGHAWSELEKRGTTSPARIAPSAAASTGAAPSSDTGLDRRRRSSSTAIGGEGRSQCSRSEVFMSAARARLAVVMVSQVITVESMNVQAERSTITLELASAVSSAGSMISALLRSCSPRKQT